MSSCLPCGKVSLPHARGGVSRWSGRRSSKSASSPRTWGCFGTDSLRMERLASSPRTWGCFGDGISPPHAALVFPTHVGVFLHEYFFFDSFIGLPHARGGVSAFKIPAGGEKLSSPRTWGCFLKAVATAVGIFVFPTHVGVFLLFPEMPLTPPRLPHARGGVSDEHAIVKIHEMSSPRTWGCFSRT